MTAINALCNAIDRGAWYFALAALSGMSLLVIVDVLSRYLLRYSFTWVEELTRYLMVWMTLIGGASAIRQGELISVGVLKSRLPPAAARVVLVIGHLLIGAFLALLLYHGIALVQRSWVFTTPALRIPFAWVYLALPLGSGLMLIQTFGFLWQTIAQTDRA